MKIVASSPISWDREKSGGKSDQASSTTCHSISIPDDEIPDLTVAGYATVPPTGIMDEGCAGMFN